MDLLSLYFLGFVIVMLVVRSTFRVNEQISLLKEIRDYLKILSKTDGIN